MLRERKDGGAREWILDADEVRRIEAGGLARFTHADLPFDVVADGLGAQLRAAARAAADAPRGHGRRLGARGARAAPAERAEPPRRVGDARAEGRRPERARDRSGAGRSSRGTSRGSRRSRAAASRWTCARSGGTLPVPHRPQALRASATTRARAMPAEFSSYVTKLEAGTTRDVHITMNEPLRHRGYTLYQSGWGPQADGTGQGPPWYSTFSVVHNPSDRVPMDLVRRDRRSGSCSTSSASCGATSRRVGAPQRAGGRVRPPLAPPRAATSRRALVRALRLAALGAIAACAASSSRRLPRGVGGRRRPRGGRGRLRRALLRGDARGRAAASPSRTAGASSRSTRTRGYTLLALNHKRSVKDGAGEDAPTLSAIEWLLDVMFRPERARRYPVLLARDVRGPRRHRGDARGPQEARPLLLRDLFPERAARPACELAAPRRRAAREATTRSSSRRERRSVDLYRDVSRFERCRTSPTSRARRWRRHGDELVARSSAGRERVRGDRASLARAADLAKLVAAGGPARGARRPTRTRRRSHGLRERVTADAGCARPRALALVPPRGREGPPARVGLAWRTPSGGARARTRSPRSTSRLVAAFSAMTASAGDAARVRARDRRTSRSGSAPSRDAAASTTRSALEVTLHRLDPFGRAVWLYVFAFLVVALSWLRPLEARSRSRAWGLMGLAAVALQVTGIVMRCIIREPPADLDALRDGAVHHGARRDRLPRHGGASQRRGDRARRSRRSSAGSAVRRERLRDAQGQDTMPSSSRCSTRTSGSRRTSPRSRSATWAGSLAALVRRTSTCSGRAFGVRARRRRLLRARSRA